MGSGAFGEAGFGQASYQNNLRIQSDRGGTMTGHNGSPSAELAHYDIVPTMNSGTDWGSYFYAGGPGALIPWGYIGSFFPAGHRSRRSGGGPTSWTYSSAATTGRSTRTGGTPATCGRARRTTGRTSAASSRPARRSPRCHVIRTRSTCSSAATTASSTRTGGTQAIDGRDATTTGRRSAASSPRAHGWQRWGGAPTSSTCSCAATTASSTPTGGTPATNGQDATTTGRQSAASSRPARRLPPCRATPTRSTCSSAATTASSTPTGGTPATSRPQRNNNWASIGGFFPPGAPPAAVAPAPRPARRLHLRLQRPRLHELVGPGDLWPGAQNDWAPIGGFFPRGTSISAVSRNPRPTRHLHLRLQRPRLHELVEPRATGGRDATTDWASIGGTFPAGAPPAAVSRNPDQLDVFITGNDGVVYTNWWNPSDQWPGSTGGSRRRAGRQSSQARGADRGRRGRSSGCERSDPIQKVPGGMFDHVLVAHRPVLLSSSSATMASPISLAPMIRQITAMIVAFSRAIQSRSPPRILAGAVALPGSRSPRAHQTPTEGRSG